MIKRWSTKRKVKQVERIIMSLGYDRFDDIDIDGVHDSRIEFIRSLQALGVDY